MNELEFYKTINNYLKEIGNLSNINDLEKYYKQTNLLIPGIKELKKDSINQVFAEFIFMRKRCK